MIYTQYDIIVKCLVYLYPNRYNLVYEYSFRYCKIIA
jgi:hypothetical protein